MDTFVHNQVKEHRGSRRVVVTGVLCAFTILQFFLQGSLSVMSHEVKRDFDIDAASISLLSSAFFYSYILLQIPVGLIFDKFGMRKTCFIALLVMGLACFGFASLKSFTMALVFRVIMGAGASFSFIAMLRSIKLYYPADNFIFVMSVLEAFGMIGIAGFNIFFSFLTDVTSWRVSIVTSGILCFVLAVIWHKLDVSDNGREVNSSETSMDAAQQESSMLYIIKRVFSYKLMWLNGLYMAFLYAIVTVFVSLWGIPYTEKLYGISTTEAAFLVSFIYAGLGLSSLFLSLVISIFNMKLILRFGTFMAIFFLGWYIYFPPEEKLLAYILLFLVGSSCSVYQLAFGLVAQNIPKDVQSTAGGVTNMLCMLGAPVLQPLIGLALTLTQGGFLDGYESYEVNQYRSAFMLLMLWLVFSFIVSWFIFPVKKIESSS